MTRSIVRLNERFSVAHHIVVGLMLAARFWAGTLHAQNAPQAAEARCTLSGRILNRATNQSIGGARVELSGVSASIAALTSPSYVTSGNRRKSSHDINTQSLNDGSFCLSEVQPGQYVLSSGKPGFLDASYGAKNYLETGYIISVGAAPLSGLDVAPDPMSGIAGQVSDASGEAVADMNVVALKQIWYQGRQFLMPVQGTQSDERGRYRIGKLTAGTYFVYARPLPSFEQTAPGTASTGHAVRTYYPSTLRLSDGAPVLVSAGQDATGVDIRVMSTRTYHVIGRIAGRMDEWLGGTVRLVPSEEEPMALVFGSGNISAQGSFDFPDIEPGAYKLEFQSRTGAGQMPIEVKDADVSSVVSVVGNAALRGRVRAEDFPDSVRPTMPTITLKLADAVVGPSYQANVDSSGVITADGVRPGKYFLGIATPPGEFVKSIQSGASELSGRELDLTFGGTISLTVAIGYGTASLNVTVAKSGESDNGVTTSPQIVLVSIPSKIDGSGIYLGPTDDAGQVTFTNVAPGKYRVAAVPELDPRLFHNPILLKNIAAIGADVDLQPNQGATIQLPAISRDALEQVFAQSNAAR